jgi:hypothetical protein
MGSHSLFVALTTVTASKEAYLRRNFVHSNPKNIIKQKEMRPTACYTHKNKRK